MLEYLSATGRWWDEIGIMNEKSVLVYLQMQILCVCVVVVGAWMGGKFVLGRHYMALTRLNFDFEFHISSPTKIVSCLGNVKG